MQTVLEVNDPRKVKRKSLRAPGTLSVNGAATRFDSVDLSTNGICILTENQLQAGEIYRVEFMLFIEGKRLPINVLGKVSYCICGRDGFRSGLLFSEFTDKDSVTAVHRFLR